MCILYHIFSYLVIYVNLFKYWLIIFAFLLFSHDTVLHHIMWYMFSRMAIHREYFEYLLLIHLITYLSIVLTYIVCYMCFIRWQFINCLFVILAQYIVSFDALNEIIWVFINYCVTWNFVESVKYLLLIYPMLPCQVDKIYYTYM